MHRLPVGLILGVFLFIGMIEPVRAQNHAFTVYGGRVTDDRWFESLTLSTGFVDANILVGAWAWTIKRFHGGDLTLEIEGQLAKYFGGQNNLEFNIPMAVRWHRFIWDETVDTSIAFGLGPSWASEDPKIELMFNDSTRQFLVHWFFEIALGPPDAHWAGVFRLHHRSTGFGTVADEGGSNTLTAGMKFRF
jgi:hypothetical protein